MSTKDYEFHKKILSLGARGMTVPGTFGLRTGLAPVAYTANMSLGRELIILRSLAITAIYSQGNPITYVVISYLLRAQQ